MIRYLAISIVFCAIQAVGQVGFTLPLSSYCVNSAPTTNRVTCPSPTLATNDFLVVSVGARGLNAGSVTQMTDDNANGSNSYAREVASNTNSNMLLTIWTAQVINGGGGTVNVTVVLSGVPTAVFVAVGVLHDPSGSVTFTPSSADGICYGVVTSANNNPKCTGSLSSFVSSSEYVISSVIIPNTATWTAGTGFTVNVPTAANFGMVQSGSFATNPSPAATISGTSISTIVALGVKTGTVPTSTVSFNFFQSANYCVAVVPYAASITCESPTLRNGDLIVAMYGARGGMNSATISSVADDQGNTYAQNVPGFTATQNTSIIGIATAPVVYGNGATADVTVTFSTSPSNGNYLAVGTLHDSANTFTAASFDGKCTGAGSAVATPPGLTCSAALDSFVGTAEYVIATAMGQQGLSWSAGANFALLAPSGTNYPAVQGGGVSANFTPAIGASTNISGTIAAIGIKTSAVAVVFTALNSGDWNTPATWNKTGTAQCHVTIPCGTDAQGAGDSVTIPASLNITCMAANELCSAGDSRTSNTPCIQTSGSGAGSLHIGSSATFVFKCTMQLIFGSIILDAGAKVYNDNTWVSQAPSSSPFYFYSTNTTTATQWNVTGTASAHVLWDGDGCDNPATANPATCSTGGACAGRFCLAAAVNYNCSSLPTNVGTGSVTYFDVMNFQGCTQGASNGLQAWTTSINGANSFTATALTFTNLDVVRFRLAGTGSGNITINGLKTLQCRTLATNRGCMVNETVAGFSGTGRASISGYVADFTVTNLTGGGFWSYTNLYLHANGNNNVNGMGFSNGDDSPVVEMLHLQNSFNQGANPSYVIPHWPVQATYSINWADATINNHKRNINIYFNTPVVRAPYTNQYNFFGIVGGACSSSSNCVINGSITANSAQGPTPGTTTINYTFNNDVYGCGFDGNGYQLVTGSYFQGSWGTSTTPAPASVTQSHNTVCSMQGVTQQPGSGSAASESATVWPMSGGLLTSVDSWIYFCGAAGGCAMAGVWGPPSTNTQANTFNFIGNSAAVNTTGWTMTDSFYAAKVTCAVAGNCGPVLTKSYAPLMIDPMRTLALFDVQYLIPAGLLPATVYTNDPQWRGAWAVNTAYNQGDIVSWSNSSAWGGQTTYWRCRAAHTSDPATSTLLNQPVLSNDLNNPQYGWTPFWEEAVFHSWVEPQVFANATFGPYCAALVGVSCPATVHAVGLLNAWLRQGYVSYDSTLWSACNNTECGANPMPMIQHIPPMVIMP